ncbi:hypothetical protein HDV63DRAFT_390748 [Trichoderma sp. SZMC 28014]
MRFKVRWLVLVASIKQVKSTVERAWLIDANSSFRQTSRLKSLDDLKIRHLHDFSHTRIIIGRRPVDRATRHS